MLLVLTERPRQDNRLVQIEIHMNTMSNLLVGKALSYGNRYRPILPPKPPCMYGRKREQEAIVSILVGSSPPRIAILGAGGIGKTTLAVSVLYDPRVIDRYESRYFVACDGVTSSELLLTELANVLRVPRDQLDDNMHDIVLSSFRRDTPIVICFDNFETAWGDLASRRAVEELLLEFTAIPSLALLVTMRGTQRPAPSAGWSTPLLPPLHSLHFEDAVDIFRAIAGGVDEFAKEMIREVDCIPLAVTLLAHMVQEENETTESLVKRWKKERTGLIENGGDDRLSKLDTSIQCSVSSPRMAADPSAAHVLALLSILPDGFPDRGGLLDKLQSYLPPDVNLHRAVSTLKRVALVHSETLNEHLRIRLLSPVRHFSKANLRIPPEYRTALVDLYIQLLEDGRDHADPRSHIIPPELLNIQGVFAEAYACGDRRESLIKASMAYTEWLVFMGSGADDMIQLAIQNTTSDLLPPCFYWLGRLCVRRNDVDGAHRAFSKAIELHVEAQDAAGEAYDLYELGGLYLDWGKLKEAEIAFKRALQLHTADRDYLGEAYDLLELGKLFMRAGQLGDAEICMSDALHLLRSVQYVVGQARALRRLAGVFMRQERLDEAESSLHEAVRLHRQTKSVLGEAHDLRRLGGLQLWRHQLKEAEASFHRAADLHRQAHDLLGEANDLASMSELRMEQGRLSEAESYLAHALKLHEQTQNVMGKGNDMQSLGELYVRRQQLPEAEAALKQAVELHRQAGDIMSRARDMQKLGGLYSRMGTLERAAEAFRDAVDLYQQAKNQAGEIEGLQSLAKLYAESGNRKAEREIIAALSSLKPTGSSKSGECVATGEEVLALRVPRDLDMINRLDWSGYSP
ncbi:hypothetical protein C8F01DRAFT_497203 [Mycena amicta]|nr:hypothetical protein C8F01DRAFT_497203 [Mycena amicta]